MGTISEKALYLNETKRRIKDRINLIGGDLDDTNTFREYAEELDSIYDDMPKVEGEGSNFTINQTRKGGLEVTPKGNCEQEVITAVAGTTVEGSNLTVNDFDTTKEMTITPEGKCEQTTYTGKNLLPRSLTSKDQNGLIFTANGDGTITVNGTATATTYYNLEQAILEAGDYVLSGCPSGGTDSTYRVVTKYGNKYQIDYGTGKTFSLSETTTPTERYIMVVNGTTANNLIFKPMIEAGSTKTSYEPFVNKLPSPSPSYPQDVKIVTNGLPNEYQAVEYIQLDSTNPYTTFITSGITYNDFSRIEVKYSFTNVVVSNPMIFASYRWSTTASEAPFICANGNKSGDWVITPTIEKTSINTPTEFIITSTISSTNMLKIGGWGDNSWTAVGRYYYVRIYNSSNQLIFNGIPCYRKNDNAIGMYDIVNGVFYTNAGTGTFTKGNDVQFCYEVVVQNKNLMNYADTVLLNGMTFSIANVSPNTEYYCKAYNINDTYTGSFSVFYKISDAWVQQASRQLTEGFSITTPDNCTAIAFNGLSNPDDRVCQVELGTTPSSYVAHQEQSYTLHLGSLELCKIGNYKDYITGKKNNWKLVKNIGKVELNSFDYTRYTHTTLGRYFWTSITPTPKYLHFYDTAYLGLCNKYRIVGRNVDDFVDYTFCFDGTSGSVTQMQIKNSNYDDATEFKNSLVGTFLYYPLATPTETAITDSTLVSQLNALADAYGYSGTTNIMTLSTTNNAEMPIEVHYNFVTPAPSPDRPSEVKVVTGESSVVISDTDISTLPNTQTLPSAYQQVEYIESYGNEYINTQFIPTSNTKIFVKASTKGETGKTALFGSRTPSFCSFIESQYGGVYNSIRIDAGSVEGNTGKQWTINEPFTIEVDSLNKYVKVNNETISKYDNFTFSGNNYNMYLFTISTSGSVSYPIAGKIYNFKIWNNNVLVRDLIPCYRKSDNVVGMYDLVNNVFYTNQGTGTFTKGNDVNLQTLPLNLGTNYLAGISTYKDEIVGKTDDWKIVRKNKKEVWNGTESGWSYYGNAGVVTRRFIRTLEETMPDISFPPAYCNRLVQNFDYPSPDNFIKLSGNICWLGSTLIQDLDVDGFKTWLNTHNLIVYYPLATPTEETITDTTLISQLNAIYNAQGYDGQTNIMTISPSTNADLVVNVKALREFPTE